MVEIFILHLGAVVPTYLHDLSLEGLLSLYHTYIVLLLLDLIPGPLRSFLCLLNLLQFLLKCNNLSFGGSQLIFSVAKEHPLALSLLLNTIKGSRGTFSFPLLLKQLVL